LAAAEAEVAEGRPGHSVWVRQKIADQSPDVWEPKGFAEYVDTCFTYSKLTNLAFQLWRVPLTRWHSILLPVKTAQERVDPASAITHVVAQNNRIQRSNHHHRPTHERSRLGVVCDESSTMNPLPFVHVSSKCGGALPVLELWSRKAVPPHSWSTDE
jgi:hypothetical protein